MKKSTIATLISLFVLIPATLLLSRILPGRVHYLTSTLVIVYILIPFFLSFEGKKPSARVLVLIAVLCALAVASRAIFAMLPNFKPIYGIIIIAGIALGAQAGFLVGAVSAFASNFLFGQGPWTPWQMLAYGTCGLLAGLLYFRKDKLPRDPVSLGLFGFISVLFVVCPLLDTSTVLTTLTVFTPTAILGIYTTAILTNLIQAGCTLVTLLAISKPMLRKIDRIITKYGLLE
ncbi:MAG: ECF transporter S component [Oscillospiraceae bacterium]|nr:ECF transporter S component [Oscillospiraceae bacterium]